MKAEVLAEWRTRLADRTLITLPAGAVERLLDERRQLLVAVHLVHLVIEGSGKMSESGLRATIDAAIAFANEP